MTTFCEKKAIDLYFFLTFTVYFIFTIFSLIFTIFNFYENSTFYDFCYVKAVTSYFFVKNQIFTWSKGSVMCSINFPDLGKNLNKNVEKKVQKFQIFEKFFVAQVVLVNNDKLLWKICNNDNWHKHLFTPLICHLYYTK